MKQRCWRSAAYWLVIRGLLTLISYRAQDDLPSDVLAYCLLPSLKYQLSIKKCQTDLLIGKSAKAISFQ